MTAPIARIDLQTVVDLGPLVAPRRVRRILPFAVAGTAGVATMPFDPDVHVALLTFAGGVAIAVVIAALVVPWPRLPRAAQPAIPMIHLVSTCVAVAAHGGLGSPLLSTLLVPLLWLAIYERGAAFKLGLSIAALFVLSQVPRGEDHDAVLLGINTVTVGCAVLPTVRTLVRGQRHLTAALNDAAERDPLTGLPNRRALDRRVEAISSDERQRGVGLLFVDLNRFKEVNDTFGRDAGDELLVEVAHRLARCVRGSDVVARVGGDEFVIVCGGDSQTAVAMVDRIRTSIAGEPFQLGSNCVELSASVGLSHSADRDADAAELLRIADQEMYAAKRARSHTAVVA